MRARWGARTRLPAAAATAVLLSSTLGCLAQEPALERPTGAATGDATGPTRASAPVPTSSPAAAEAAAALPDGPLRELVPAPTEVPAGLVPLPEASGPRDVAAVAAFSADASTAAEGLAARGFTDAYVAQYAAPDDPRVLTVVVVRFADADGARADLEADLAEGTGQVLDAARVGDESQARRVPLPDDEALDLVTVRFRAGAATWLLAWREPAPSDPGVPLALARLLAARA